MATMGYYERLGAILRERLDADDDPFAGLAEEAAKRRGEREKAHTQPKESH